MSTMWGKQKRTAEGSLQSQLLKQFIHHETRIGGAEGAEGFSGSITAPGLGAILDRIKPFMEGGFCFLDVGHGIGRPLYQVLATFPGTVSTLLGCEMCPVKAEKSVKLRGRICEWCADHGMPISSKALPSHTLVRFICSAIEHLHSIEPATIVYAAWEGWSTTSMEALGSRFSSATTAVVIVVIQKGDRTKDIVGSLLEMGFGHLELLGDNIKVTMCYGHTGLTAYCLRKRPTGPTPNLVVASEHQLLTLPELDDHDEVNLILSLSRKERDASSALATVKMKVSAANSSENRQSRRNLQHLAATAAQAAEVACVAATKAQEILCLVSDRGGAWHTCSKRAEVVKDISITASKLANELKLAATIPR